MQYMPEGNLMQANAKRKISSEEMRTALHQMLEALAYLHEKMKITHRDVKPANILLQSRTPKISIKLCDFGLATDNEHLKTLCGTKMYAAAEIYGHSYDNSIDIWATAVVALEFLRGLPKHTRGMEPDEWSAKIRERIENICGQADDPLMSLLKRMVELRSENRPSAQACLADRSMSIPQSSPSRSRSVSNVTATDSTEVLSEQPTEILTQILEPLWPVADGREGRDRPITPQGPRKRLRSSSSSTGSQVADDPQKQTSTGRLPDCLGHLETPKRTFAKSTSQRNEPAPKRSQSRRLLSSASPRHLTLPARYPLLEVFGCNTC